MRWERGPVPFPSSKPGRRMRAVVCLPFAEHPLGADTMVGVNLCTPPGHVMNEEQHLASLSVRRWKLRIEA